MGITLSRCRGCIAPPVAIEPEQHSPSFRDNLPGIAIARPASPGSSGRSSLTLQPSGSSIRSDLQARFPMVGPTIPEDNESTGRASRSASPASSSRMQSSDASLSAALTQWVPLTASRLVARRSHGHRVFTPRTDSERSELSAARAMVEGAATPSQASTVDRHASRLGVNPLSTASSNMTPPRLARQRPRSHLDELRGYQSA